MVCRFVLIGAFLGMSATASAYKGLESDIKNVRLTVDKISCNYEAGKNAWGSRIHIAGMVNERTINEDAVISFSECAKILSRLGLINPQKFSARFNISELSSEGIGALIGSKYWFVENVLDDSFNFGGKSY